MIKYRLIDRIAGHADARINCIETDNDWLDHHTDIIKSMSDLLPYGFDSGSAIDIEESNGEKIVIRTSFHHMNSVGYYCGWSEHVLTITASLIHGTKINIESDMSCVDIEGMYDPGDEYAEDFQPDDGDLSAELEWLEDSTQDFIVEAFDYALNSIVVWDKEKERYTWEPEELLRCSALPSYYSLRLSCRYYCREEKKSRDPNTDKQTARLAAGRFAFVPLALYLSYASLKYPPFSAFPSLLPRVCSLPGSKVADGPPNVIKTYFFEFIRR